jgi:ribonuclease HI
MSIIRLHFDGSCEPTNPDGMAGYGYHISVDDKEYSNGTGTLGYGLGNNYAEFYAAYKGLEAVNAFIKADDMLFVKGDSLLVINILKKRWRTRPYRLYYPAFELASAELQKIRDKDVAVFLDWVPREQNTFADELSKGIKK